LQRDVTARIEGLVKNYRTETGTVHALQGVDAEFSAGAVTAVVGPSGSGKSSLLRVLAGLDSANKGSVIVGEVDLAKARSKTLREVRRSMVGYIFQRPSDNFISYLTVDEHLSLAARSRKGEVPDARELLEHLGIGDRGDHLPNQLSGGEQQRAAFAQVLMAGPRLIVADEPTAELDSRSAESLLELVRDLSKDGVGFIIATHDHKVAEAATKIIEIDHGLIKSELAAGLPQSVARQHDLVAASRTRNVGRTRSSVYARPGQSDRSYPLIRVSSLTKSFRRGPETVHALEDVSLTLESGQMAGLMGRSGSGKTTLLNILAGWEEADAGTIEWVEGGAPDRLDVIPWKDVSVVPQKLGLIEELTVRKNIEYPARLSGLLEETRERVEELISELGLEDLADRVPLETSVGQQQRTALARALVLSPRLILADEPSGHQDAVWARGVFRSLRAATAEGTCCLVATHNEEMINNFDVVYAMVDGRIQDTIGGASLPNLRRAIRDDSS
jgi:ABC-type lipoprotein export system ATPase subunit